MCDVSHTRKGLTNVGAAPYGVRDQKCQGPKSVGTKGFSAAPQNRWYQRVFTRPPKPLVSKGFQAQPKSVGT